MRREDTSATSTTRAPTSDAPRVRIIAQRDPDAWRTQARNLLLADLSPDAIEWIDPSQAQATFEFEANPKESRERKLASSALVQQSRASTIPTSNLTVPKRFLDITRLVLAHADSGKYETLYRVLWRIARREEKHLLDNAVDPDIAKLRNWAKAVRRDMHKMKAFVRFRKVADDSSPDGVRYIAFHRPEFDILGLIGPFFARRFGVMQWTIMTPRGTLIWNGDHLQAGPPATRRDAPQGDELEEFWKTYYASVFNPARANEKAMLKEMPKKHWATMPEASLIDELLRSAARRTGDMVDAAPTSGRSAADYLPKERAPSLNVLQKAAEHCKGCDLHKHATQTVFGEGPSNARIMLIGEQPGNDEDLQGHPFVGPAGQLLDQALIEAKLERSTLYITNAVKHFKWTPKGTLRLHTKPGVREMHACRPWLEHEIGAVRPDVIVLLGATAAQSLLGPAFRITKSRGQPITHTQWAHTLIATYHPSAVLRAPDPAMKAEQYTALVSDLKLAKKTAG